MDSGHSNEARWPNNTLLTYTLPRTVKVRESLGVRTDLIKGTLQESRGDNCDPMAQYLPDLRNIPCGGIVLLLEFFGKYRRLTSGVRAGRRRDN